MEEDTIETNKISNDGGLCSRSGQKNQRLIK